MNYFRFIALLLFMYSIPAFSALAQVPVSPPKIAFIDTTAFYDEKAGITKLVNANKQIDTEFAARIKELQDGGTKLQSIVKELDTMQNLPSAQFNQAAYVAKKDEAERLERDLNYKKTDLEAAINKRRNVLISPISQDIGKAIEEYAKKNGYGVVLDISKLGEVNAVLYFAEIADTTKDFIAFYNKRSVAAGPN